VQVEAQVQKPAGRLQVLAPVAFVAEFVDGFVIGAGGNENLYRFPFLPGPPDRRGKVGR